MSKRVGIWIRVSTEDQAKGESPQHHEERAKMYAQLQEWEVIEVYHLEAVSGKAVMHHPEAKRMIKDIRSGHINGLIFSKLARLARNTKELLEFADLFKTHKADLISLEEKIDTSSPAGRFFYTLIAAMAEWERGEISARVTASIPIRAKLGKSLGGEAPYGYMRENKQLVVNPEEAPIRKLIHQLFIEHKRKRVVAKIINERGYRTRTGTPFTDTTIDRYLRDPITKGLRRVNYTHHVTTGNKEEVKFKPKEEWIFHPAPRIITDEEWEMCNDILMSMTKKYNKVRSRGIHLFTGVTYCTCGAKMYCREKSPKYICKNCKNKIEPDILEEIFHSQLQGMLFSDAELQSRINAEKVTLEEKRQLLTVLETEFSKIRERIQNVFDLYHEKIIPKESFQEQYAPLIELQQQKQSAISELQASIDMLAIHSLSSDQVLHDARNLYIMWHSFSKEDKKNIIEVIVEKIVIGSDEVDISLSYLPTLPSVTTNYSAYPSEAETAAIVESTDSTQLVRICNETEWG